MLDMVKTRKQHGKDTLDAFKTWNLSLIDKLFFTKSLIKRFYKIKSHNQAVGERAHLPRPNFKFNKYQIYYINRYSSLPNKWRRV